MTALRDVELTAIELATAYAEANGYRPGDRRAVGLVLAGMVIGAQAAPAVRDALYEGYLAQHPGARHTIDAWAAALLEAHERRLAR